MYHTTDNARSSTRGDAMTSSTSKWYRDLVAFMAGGVASQSVRRLRFAHRRTVTLGSCFRQLFPCGVREVREFTVPDDAEPLPFSPPEPVEPTPAPTPKPNGIAEGDIVTSLLIPTNTDVLRPGVEPAIARTRRAIADVMSASNIAYEVHPPATRMLQRLARRSVRARALFVGAVDFGFCNAVAAADGFTARIVLASKLAPCAVATVQRIAGAAVDVSTQRISAFERSLFLVDPVRASI